MYVMVTVAMTARPYVHPGIIVNGEMLNQIRANVGSKTEPQYSAFNAAASARVGAPPGVWLANLTYEPHPVQLDQVNASLSPGTRWLTDKEDSIAAYTHALLWYVTGDKRHAHKAAEIMDAWSRVLTRPPQLADSLEAAWSATSWARAAEIVRHTSDAWSDDGVRAFERLLQHIYLQMVDQGASTNGNIALVMREAALHIGVFADNETAVDNAIALFRRQAPAYLYLSSDGPLPKRPPAQRYLAKTAPTCGPSCSDAELVTFWHGNTEFEGHDGIAQETCRDLGHTSMLLAAFTNVCETAWHQVLLITAQQARAAPPHTPRRHAPYRAATPVHPSGHRSLRREPRTPRRRRRIPRHALREQPCVHPPGLAELALRRQVHGHPLRPHQRLDLRDGPPPLRAAVEHDAAERHGAAPPRPANRLLGSALLGDADARRPALLHVKSVPLRNVPET